MTAPHLAAQTAKAIDVTSAVVLELARRRSDLDPVTYLRLAGGQRRDNSVTLIG